MSAEVPTPSTITLLKVISSRELTRIFPSSIFMVIYSDDQIKDNKDK
jgi:hypothetical protein